MQSFIWIKKKSIRTVHFAEQLKRDLAEYSKRHGLQRALESPYGSTGNIGPDIGDAGKGAKAASPENCRRASCDQILEAVRQKMSKPTSAPLCYFAEDLFNDLHLTKDDLNDCLAGKQVEVDTDHSISLYDFRRPPAGSKPSTDPPRRKKLPMTYSEFFFGKGGFFFWRKPKEKSLPRSQSQSLPRKQYKKPGKADSKPPYHLLWPIWSFKPTLIQTDPPRRKWSASPPQERRLRKISDVAFHRAQPSTSQSQSRSDVPTTSEASSILISQTTLSPPVASTSTAPPAPRLPRKSSLKSTKTPDFARRDSKGQLATPKRVKLDLRRESSSSISSPRARRKLSPWTYMEPESPFSQHPDRHLITPREPWRTSPILNIPTDHRPLTMTRSNDLELRKPPNGNVAQSSSTNDFLSHNHRPVARSKPNPNMKHLHENSVVIDHRRPQLKTTKVGSPPLVQRKTAVVARECYTPPPDYRLIGSEIDLCDMNTPKAFISIAAAQTTTVTVLKQNGAANGDIVRKKPRKRNKRKDSPRKEPKLRRRALPPSLAVVVEHVDLVSFLPCSVTSPVQARSWDFVLG